jgi:multidrug efflux system outer membrane protein
MRRCGIVLFVLLSLSLALGCGSVGPDYHRKDPTVPDRFGSVDQSVTTSEAVGSELLSSWWKILQDPVLNSLIDRAVRDNQDIHIAQARVQQARALSLFSSSKHYPEGGPSGTYERFRRTESGTSRAGSGGGSIKREDDLFLAGFDASWEIDVFGGIRREIEASEAELAGSEDSLRDVLITLQGEVARNYIEYRGIQLRLDIARKEVEIRKESAEIIDARVRAGFVSELDLARARGELASAESRIPSLENSLSATLHRIGVLLGSEPMSLATELRASAVLPRVPENLPAGLPSDLLRRRPDIRRAERDVAAATARIGVSTAQLFPKFSLTGTFGYQSNESGSVFRDASNFWTIGPTIRWPIFNFKRILATIEFSKAVQKETLARYEKSVLYSLEEVENSLVVLSQEKRRAEALTEAVASNDLAVQLANERYLAGLQSYLAVIDALSAQYTAQDELAQSMQKQVLGFVSLYKALGGGWLDMYGTDDQGTN